MNERNIPPADLAAALRLAIDPDAGLPDDPDTLGAMLAELLRTPLLEAFAAVLGDTMARAATRIVDEGDPPITTFNDALHHARPPAGLLLFVKEYAKAAARHDTHPLPKPISRVLYLALASGQGQDISRLDASTLLDGLARALAEPWLDAATRQLLHSAC